MAKKLTDEQKAANKAAQKLRDAAWRARRKAYEQAEGSMTRQLQASAEQGAADVAFARLNERRDAYQVDDDALCEKIAALEKQRAMLKDTFLSDIETLRATRDAAQKELQQVQARLKADLDSSFPDLKNCWYVAAWQPPEGYIEEFAKTTNEGKK